MRFPRGKRWLPQVALAVGILAVIGTVWLVRRPQEPTFAGRSFRSWMAQAAREVTENQFTQERSEVSPKVVSAFRAMGTNAQPLLLDLALHKSAPTPRQSFAGWLLRHFPRAGRWLPNWLTATSEKPYAAWCVLRKLSPPLSLLLSEATNLLASAKLEDRETGVGLLGLVGDDQEIAARLLAPLVLSSNGFEAGAAMSALQRLGPAAHVALPELIVRLDDSFRYPPYDNFSAIGPAASNALPALRRRFDTETEQPSKLHIALVANDVDPHEFWAEGLVRAALAVNAAEEFCRNVVGTLSWKTNLIPRFTRELGALVPTSPRYLAFEALQTLRKLPGDQSVLLPLLTQGLVSGHADIRAVAALHLLKLEPTNRPAFTCITNLLADLQAKDVPREWLLGGLARLGPAAAPALPVIRAQATLSSPSVRSSAEAAIRAIEGTRQ